MHWLTRSYRAAFGLAALAAIHAHALYTEITPPGSLMVMNLPAQATLSIGGTQQVLKGQVSAHGSFTAGDIKAGVIKLSAFNLVLPDVDQTALTGIKPKRGGAKSVLGIALSAAKSAPALKYDDATGVASGQLPVSIDFAQLEELLPSREAQDPKEPDAYDMKRQLGTLSVQIKFDQPLSKALLEKVSKRYGSVQMKLDANPVADAFGKILVNRYLLDFARERPLKLGEVDVNAAIGEALFLIANQSRVQNVTLKQELRNVPAIEADFGQIRQALVNILINACDAMPNGGTLVVRSQRMGDQVEIAVRDTGIGISPEHLKKVLDPFFTTKEKGTGLGLSVVYGIIERHGGALKIDSTPGEGTTVTITLPVFCGSPDGSPGERERSAPQPQRA